MVPELLQPKSPKAARGQGSSCSPDADLHSVGKPKSFHLEHPRGAELAAVLCSSLSVPWGRGGRRNPVLFWGQGPEHALSMNPGILLSLQLSSTGAGTCCKGSCNSAAIQIQLGCAEQSPHAAGKEDVALSAGVC